jgi:hypothetical protein
MEVTAIKPHEPLCPRDRQQVVRKLASKEIEIDTIVPRTTRTTHCRAIALEDAVFEIERAWRPAVAVLEAESLAEVAKGCI